MADTLSWLDFEETTTKSCEMNLIKYVYEDHIKVPVDLKFLAEQQLNDEELAAGREKYPEKFIDSDIAVGPVVIPQLIK